MVCTICRNKTKEIFNATILNKYNIKYYQCRNCGFLQTEKPYWLQESYEKPINISDTGYINRNINLSQKLTILLMVFFNKNGRFLDYAGGYGVFVRMMRDIGFDYYWDDKYTQNLFARGFELSSRMEFEAVTTFESFEHFVNPNEEIKSLLKISKNIIFSTELLPNPVPKPQDWWYYGLDHGQHISFYTKKTFYYLAQMYDLNYANLGSFHVLTEKSLTDFKLNIIKLNKLGLHNLLQRQLKSKTWIDHLKMSI